jgi:hypothetical protein
MRNDADYLREGESLCVPPVQTTRRIFDRIVEL